MTGALIILVITIITGFVLWATHKPGEPVNEPKVPVEHHGGLCCGRHAVCDKFPLPPAEPVYYDDEELDQFKGRNNYTADEEELFRDVLYTLLPADRLGWAQSMEQRGIMLPPAIRSELVALINEDCNA